MSGWIRVEDRLPENWQRVIIHGAGYTKIPQVKSGYRTGTYWRTDSGGSISVTHWQPMPEPPVEVGK